jgi:AraC-like DNA-binding protein
LVFSPDFLVRISIAFREMQKLVEDLNSLNGALKFTRPVANSFIQILEDMEHQSDAARLSGLVHLLVLLSENMNKAKTIGEIDRITDSEKKLKEIETYINCNFNRNISIDDMARYVGMNRSSFCTFFQKMKKMTFVTYLNAYRIDIACNFLSRNKDNIADICYKSGFRDIPYFNRVFKRIKGVTPGEFRDQKAES